MLNFQVTGPKSSGEYLVTYRTPGCNTLTVVRICRTFNQANDEVIRLNASQITRNNPIRNDLKLGGDGFGLEGKWDA